MATVELLQAQVTALTQRMDHMASQVSALRFTQSFCEKLESEAELQLIRLRLVDSFQSIPSSEPELTTARLLHGMVETMLQLRQDCCNEEVTSDFGLRPGRIRVVPAASSAAGRSGDASAPNSSSPPGRRGWDDDGSSSASRRAPAAALRPEPLRMEGLGYGGYEAGLPSSPQREPMRTADFGAPPQVDYLQSTLEFDGFSLGKGTWAEAYRRAAPGSMRREALKMLGSLGIVTEKELADDLTVISDEHIEECVSIAQVMLRRWPPSQGLPPVQQAKEFFQNQLEAMYRNKVPSPCHG